MKHYLMSFVMTLGLISCGNKVEVPSQIEAKVDIPETTQTVHVIHSVEVSVQMEEFFRSSCTTQIDSAPVPLPEPERTKAIDACVSLSIQKFITDLLSLISTTPSTGQQ